ncbi:MAG TPA: hypothetical protein VGF04_08455 [Solirubrobacterales bacterium]|jgi:hypothetical protein
MRREDGTASIEAIAVVPFLLLAVLAAAQIGLVGQSLWSAAIAARAGARSALVGGSASDAARRALPAPLREGSEAHGGRLTSVQVPVPILFPAGASLSVEAETTLDGAGG